MELTSSAISTHIPETWLGFEPATSEPQKRQPSFSWATGSHTSTFSYRTFLFCSFASAVWHEQKVRFEPVTSKIQTLTLTTALPKDMKHLLTGLLSYKWLTWNTLRVSFHRVRFTTHCQGEAVEVKNNTKHTIPNSCVVCCLFHQFLFQLLNLSDLFMFSHISSNIHLELSSTAVSRTPLRSISRHLFTSWSSYNIINLVPQGSSSTQIPALSRQSCSGQFMLKNRRVGVAGFGVSGAVM